MIQLTASLELTSWQRRISAKKNLWMLEFHCKGQEAKSCFLATADMQWTVNYTVEHRGMCCHQCLLLFFNIQSYYHKYFFFSYKNISYYLISLVIVILMFKLQVYQTCFIVKSSVWKQNTSWFLYIGSLKSRCSGWFLTSSFFFLNVAVNMHLIQKIQPNHPPPLPPLH